MKILQLSRGHVLKKCTEEYVTYNYRLQSKLRTRGIYSEICECLGGNAKNNVMNLQVWTHARCVFSLQVGRESQFFFLFLFES